MKRFPFIFFLLLFLSVYAVADLPSGPDSIITILDGPILRSRAAHEAAWYEESKVQERLLAMKATYPEGRAWTDNNKYTNTYLWYDDDYDGVNITYTGGGCAGFALIMSDAGFGEDLPMWKVTDVSFASVRIGDILRVNNNGHSVIIIDKSATSVTIAEGNYNSSIHWGRILSASEVNAADYMLTRWPGVEASLPSEIQDVIDQVGTLYLPPTGVETMQAYETFGEDYSNVTISWVSGSTNLKDMLYANAYDTGHEYGWRIYFNNPTGTGTATFNISVETEEGTVEKDFTVTVKSLSNPPMQLKSTINCSLGQRIDLSLGVISNPAGYTEKYYSAEKQYGDEIFYYEANYKPITSAGTYSYFVEVTPSINLRLIYRFNVVFTGGGVLTLPSSLQTIEKEAFSGVPAKNVFIPLGVTYAKDAFDSGVTISPYAEASVD